jgi:hypothetical protein
MQETDSTLGPPATVIARRVREVTLATPGFHAAGMSRVARAPRCTEDKSPLCLLRRRSRSLGRIGFVGRGKCRRERNCFALVGPGHGHPASPPSVPLQVMQQIASGFKSAEVTSATLSAADAALAPRHRYFRRRLVHDCRPGWEIGSAIVLGLREEGCFELRCRPERAVPKVRALCRSKRDSKSRSRRVRAAERARSQSPSRERTRA